MPYAVAELLLMSLAAYAAIGVVVALALLVFGLQRFDTQAAAAPLIVKLMWAPGLAALWPLMITRAFGHIPLEDRQETGR